MDVQMARRSGLGRGLDELFEEQRKASESRAARGAKEPLEALIPSTLEGREARISSMDSGNPCGPGYEWINAPTSGKVDPYGNPRPRATKACYSIDKELEVMVIIMRDKNAMIQYDGVDPVLWDILKNSDSTNDFINLYLDGHPWSNTSYGNLPRKRPDEFDLGREF
jgi:hypothetical protein